MNFIEWWTVFRVSVIWVAFLWVSAELHLKIFIGLSEDSQCVGVFLDEMC